MIKKGKMKEGNARRRKEIDKKKMKRIRKGKK
jgi:hypothetical protein